MIFNDFQNQLDKPSNKITAELDEPSMGDELQMIAKLFNKYGLKSITDFAKEKNLTRQTVYNRIEQGKQPSMILANQIFVISIL